MVVYRWLFLAMLGFLVSCASSDAESSLDVYAAASLAEVIQPINEAFEIAHPSVEVRVQLASSSALREQLLAGAPADVFLSANERNVALLVDADVAKNATSFATNTLVVAVPSGNAAAATSAQDLSRPDLLVGLCVSSAPCGAIADAALATLNIHPAVATREPNAAALRAKLSAAEIDLAVLYASDVATSDGSIEQISPLPQASIARYVAATTSSEAAISNEYISFLLSDQAQTILGDAGFESAQ